MKSREWAFTEEMWDNAAVWWCDGFRFLCGKIEALFHRRLIWIAFARVVPDEPPHHKVQLCNPQHSTQSNWRRSSSDFDRFQNDCAAAVFWQTESGCEPFKRRPQSRYKIWLNYLKMLERISRSFRRLSWRRISSQSENRLWTSHSERAKRTMVSFIFSTK